MGPDRPDEKRRSDGQVRLRRAAAPLLLAAAWAAFFAPEIFSSGAPYYRDNLLTYLPIKAFITSELRAGRWPRWYPYESLGMPFIGQVITAVFHPHTLLSFLLEPVAALKAEILSAYLLGIAGGYRMARAARCSRVAGMVGGCALAFGGYALGMSNNLPYLLGLMMLGWVAWAALRIAADPAARRSVPLALAVALVFLGGDAQTCLLCPLLVMAAIFGSARRGQAFAVSLCAAPLTGLLVSCELLPALALSPGTVRGAGAPSSTMGLSFALHPRRLFELLLPHFVPDEVRFRIVGALLGGGTALWSSSLFAGVLTLLFAALAVRWRTRAAIPWCLAALLCTSLALGDRGRLLPVAWRLFPLLSRFRFPEKYLAPACVALALLAALGCDAAMERPRAAARAAAWAGALLGGLAIGLVLLDGPGLAWRSAGHVLAGSDPARAIVSAAWLRGAVTEMAVATLAAVTLWWLPRRPAAAALLLLLFVCDLWLGNGDQFPLVAPGAIELKTPFATRILHDDPGPLPRVVPVARPQLFSTVTLGDGLRWVAAVRTLLRPDAGGPAGIASFGVNLPGTSVRDNLLLGPRDERAAILGGRLGACHRIEAAGASPRPGDTPELVNPELGLELVRQPCVPYARLARALPVRDMDEARDRVAMGLSPREVVWEGGPRLAGDGGTVQVSSWQPGAVELKTDAESAAALVVTEAFAAGWTARVDGRTAPVHPADGVLLAAEVPAGRHTVALEYRVPGGRPGIALSLLGILACAVFAPAARILASRRRTPAGQTSNARGSPSRVSLRTSVPSGSSTTSAAEG